MPDISIVILTFNSERFIISCLDSIIAQGFIFERVVVVDNASRDGTVNLVQNKYPQVRLIINKINLGSCEARNQGIAVSSGDWVLTLDSDVVLEESFFFNIKNILLQAPGEVGMIQPKILTFDKKLVYSAGICISTLRRFYDIGSNQPVSSGFNVPGYIFGACSAAAFYRRAMLEEVREETGYFDKRFFFLAEDIDLAWRAQRKGWKARFCPNAVCYHQGNSSGFNERIRQYFSWRNRFYLIKKNEGLIRYLLKIYPVLFYDLPRFCWLALTNPYIFKGVHAADL